MLSNLRNTSWSIGLALTLSTTPLLSTESTICSRHQEYLKLLSDNAKTLGPWGDSSKGEIEIIRDPAIIPIVEQQFGREIGVFSKNPYWLWINDPVKFANGKYGIFSRILWIKALSGIAGVAVMPILPDGRIVLNRNYRHATRSWEYELPRGMLESGETVKEGAMREVREETGMIVDQCYFLGNIAPDSGLTGNVVPIYMASVVAQHDARPEESEAIEAVEGFTFEELRQGYINGFLTIQKDGKSFEIPLRDPFLAFALFQASIRQLLPAKH